MTIPVDIAAKNEKILRQIALAVSRSQGQFKLMRLRCDYRQDQRQLWLNVACFRHPFMPTVNSQKW
ncbi:MAG: hypothetical protein ACO31I_02515 [Prochlorotrichaceae cyanobacterium]|jgi:hypothetical protein